MKYLLIIPFLFFACSNLATQKNANVIYFDSGFSLSQDTVFIEIKGRMTHALKFQDKYYVLFAYSFDCDKRWLYIFDNGKIEKIVDCPKKLRIYHFDFFVKNDSIFLKPYMDDQCYYFNTSSLVWEEIDIVNDLIYEDEKFYVYSLDFGEFGGGITWFKDKKTGIEYAIRATTPLVNKIDSIYYLTSPFEVLKIENPLKLNKCDINVTYENIEQSKGYFSWHCEPKGFDIVYRDTIGEYVGFFGYSYISYHPRIISSFVWQNKLLHIYEMDTATYIVKIENDSIIPIQKIGENLRFYKGYESYRCRNQNGNNELLKFQTEDEQLFGLMEMVENKIKMLYFVNQVEKWYGTNKADSVFVKRLNLVLSGLENLKLQDVVFSENKWKTYDVTQSHNVGIRGWNSDKYTIDTTKWYLIQEDSLITNTTQYYATVENDLVRTVFFEWDKTDLIRRNNFDELMHEIFKRKLFFIDDCITLKVGKPIKEKEEKNSTEKIWETSNGLIIELYYRKENNRIRLFVYKN